jgi:hypothetical protein
MKESKDIRSYNVGASDYSKHKIQPWDIWLEYRLNPWDADIIKRVLRSKPGERRLDYEKIKHICDERIRQIDAGLDEVLHVNLAQEKSPSIQTERPGADTECNFYREAIQGKR